MARGRSIDKALPPTRALTQQRDYRARKAARIEQLEQDNAELIAENDRLRMEMSRMAERSAFELRRAREEQEEKVEAVRREVEIAWRKVGEAQEAARVQKEDGCGSSCRAIGGCDVREEGFREDVRGRGRYHTPHAHQPAPQRPTAYHPNYPSPTQQDSTMPPPSYHYPTPPTPSHRPNPSISQQSSFADKPPFDPNCCSGLFDCNALSAIPMFPPDTARTDFDLLVDVATHATDPETRHVK